MSMAFTVDSALLAGILGAEVVQVGFMATLQWKIAKVQTKVNERTDPA